MSENNSTEEVNPETRIQSLEKRVSDLEEQMMGCLRWMRYQAEKEAQSKDPNYKVQETLKA